MRSCFLIYQDEFDYEELSTQILGHEISRIQNESPAKVDEDKVFESKRASLVNQVQNLMLSLKCSQVVNYHPNESIYSSLPTIEETKRHFPIAKFKSTHPRAQVSRSDVAGDCVPAEILTKVDISFPVARDTMCCVPKNSRKVLFTRDWFQ